MNFIERLLSRAPQKPDHSPEISMLEQQATALRQKAEQSNDSAMASDFQEELVDVTRRLNRLRHESE